MYCVIRYFEMYLDLYVDLSYLKKGKLMKQILQNKLFPIY